MKLPLFFIDCDHAPLRDRKPQSLQTCWIEFNLSAPLFFLPDSLLPTKNRLPPPAYTYRQAPHCHADKNATGVLDMKQCEPGGEDAGPTRNRIRRLRDRSNKTFACRRRPGRATGCSWRSRAFCPIGESIPEVLCRSTVPTPAAGAKGSGLRRKAGPQYMQARLRAPQGCTRKQDPVWLICCVSQIFNVKMPD